MRAGRLSRGLWMLALAAPRLGAQHLPAKLADTTFWRMVNEISEPSGYFRSENFVSNETSYQWVIPDLLRTTQSGGVYLGVGPDQNFTYLVALKPKIAFIFDIRRQNMLTHLMYKALIEASTDRADFASRLFGRPRPAGLDSSSSALELFGAFQAVPPDTLYARRTLNALLDRLVKQHGFTLAPEDRDAITHVYGAFVAYGPDITYNSNQYGIQRMPSFAELQVETDSDHVARSYMASEANFRALKQLEADNLIVPLVGDFAGPKSIRAVGGYLKDHHATVTAFYLSNVEQYLYIQGDEWRRFYGNVAELPLDGSSTFIRSVFNGSGYSGNASGSLARQMLASMTAQLQLFNDGKLTGYADVIRSSR